MRMSIIIFIILFFNNHLYWFFSYCSFFFCSVLLLLFIFSVTVPSLMFLLFIHSALLFFFNFLVLFMQHYILLWMLLVKLFCISFGYTSLVGDIFSIDIVELYRTIQKMPPELNCELLLPIWTTEIIECVCKYTGRISQNLQSLSPY